MCIAQVIFDAPHHMHRHAAILSLGWVGEVMCVGYAKLNNRKMSMGNIKQLLPVYVPSWDSHPCHTQSKTVY